MAVIIINETSSLGDLKRELRVLRTRLTIVDTTERVIWVNNCPSHIARHLADLPNWKVVEAKEFALRLFINARGWAKIVNSLKQSVASDPSMWWPYFAQQAFAVELFLKCLLTFEGRIATGHHLLDLYEALSASMRQCLAEMVRQQVKDPNYDLLAFLGKAADVFPNFRYIHERLSEPPPIDLAAFAACLIACCAKALNIENGLNALDWARLKVATVPPIPIGLRNPAIRFGA
jgi:hypothetical protein